MRTTVSCKKRLTSLSCCLSPINLTRSFAIPVSSQSSSHYEFTVIPGFFYQSTLSHDRNPSHVPKTILESFGLIDTSPDKWIKFKSRMAELNRRANSGESYKFLFCGRHGQGYHNLAEEKYGPDAWNEKWSKMTGDGKIRWDDADLTEMGMAQALVSIFPKVGEYLYSTIVSRKTTELWRFPDHRKSQIAGDGTLRSAVLFRSSSSRLPSHEQPRRSN